MATTINRSNIAKRCQEIAANVIKSNGTNKGLFQTGLVLAIEHVNKHGEYNNTLLPLMVASRSFGTNLQKAAIGFVEAHSKVRFNRDLRGKKAEEAWDKGAADLFTLDKKAPAPAEIDANKRWDSYRMTAASRDDAKVNVPDKVARLVKSLQEALDKGLAVGADGKPLKLATIQRMIKDAADTIIYRDVVEATGLDGKPVMIVRQLSKAEGDKAVTEAAATEPATKAA